MLTIISGIFGGLFRLAPELMKMFTAKADRKHELDLMDKTFQLDKQRAELKLDEIKEQGRAEWATGSLDVLKTAIEGQNMASGILWIDGVRSIIRPLITLQWVVLLYPGVIIATFVLMIQSGVPVLDALNKAFGPDEKALVAFIIDFWFVGRVLDRGRTGK
uniref:Uncharacterized protein n=2 Tax=viral metagenome TaxID=1070528 RepID=A0A6M3JX10_9ZZZZ